MPITKQRKAAIFTEFGGSAVNTGSTEGQIALLTERILEVSKHMQQNKGDFSTNRGLLRMVSHRKRLLAYLQRTNLEGYRELIKKLGLRK